MPRERTSNNQPVTSPSSGQSDYPADPLAAESQFQANETVDQRVASGSGSDTSGGSGSAPTPGPERYASTLTANSAASMGQQARFLLRMQQTHGNAYTRQVVQLMRAREGQKEAAPVQRSPDAASGRPPVQRDILDDIADAATEVGEGVSDAGSAVADTASEAGSAAVDAIGDAGSAVAGAAGDAFSAVVGSLSEVLGPMPSVTGPELVHVVLDVFNNPVVQALPGFVMPPGVGTMLQANFAMLEKAYEIYQNPEPVMEAMQQALSEMVAQAPAAAMGALHIALSAAGVHAARDVSGVEKALEQRLGVLQNEWWDMLKKMAGDLIWPWDKLGGDMEHLWDHLSGAVSNLWNLEFSAAVDDVIAFAQAVNSILGKLYGWFLVASVLVGAIVGSIEPGGGTLAGAGAGLAFAGEAGEVLVAALVITETANIVKAAIDLAGIPVVPEDRETPAQRAVRTREYNRIADSAVTLGITGAMMVIGELAVDLAKAVIGKVAEMLGIGGEEAAGGAAGGETTGEGTGEGTGETGEGTGEGGETQGGESGEGTREGTGEGGETQGGEETPGEETPGEETPGKEPAEGEGPGQECFVAGTPVLLAKGLLPIQLVQVGDSVVSHDPITDERDVHPVTQNSERIVPDVLDLFISGTVITCSPEHPFWVADSGWTPARLITPGALLLTFSGETVTLNAVKKRHGAFTVYNMTVDVLHTYFVGELGVLVHNKAMKFSFRQAAQELLERINELREARGGEADPQLDALEERARQIETDAGTETDLTPEQKEGLHDALDQVDTELSALEDAALEELRASPEWQGASERVEAATERLQRLRQQADEVPNNLRERPGVPNRQQLLDNIATMEEQVDLLRRDLQNATSPDEVARINGDLEAAESTLNELQASLNEAFVPVPTAEESAMIAEYTEQLAQLRQALETGDQEAAEAARAALDQIEGVAVENHNNPDSELSRLVDQIDSLTDARRQIEEGTDIGANRFGQRVECDATRVGRLAENTVEQVRQRCLAEGATEIPSGDIGGTGARRITWKFQDGSEVHVDFPGLENDSPFGVNREMHAGRTAPKSDLHLSDDGIAVPTGSSAAHIYPVYP